MITLGWVVFTPADPNSKELFGIIQLTGVLERFLNLFLLVPLAVFLWILFLRISLKVAFAICLLTSLVIEIAQLRIPGRVSDPIDVFTNTLGAACFLIYANWKEKAKCI